MILMQIFAVVGEDQIRRDLVAQPLDELLNPLAHEREVTVPKMLDHDPLGNSALQENLCAVFGLTGAQGRGAEDDPMDGDVGVLFGEFQERAAAADLNVVGVGAEAQHGTWGGGPTVKVEGDHGQKRGTRISDICGWRWLLPD